MFSHYKPMTDDDAPGAWPIWTPGSRLAVIIKGKDVNGYSNIRIFVFVPNIRIRFLNSNIRIFFLSLRFFVIFFYFFVFFSKVFKGKL